MIRFTVQDGKLYCVTDVRGRAAVYLDNDSIIELSKGPAPRRERFVAAIRTRGTLLFSLTNAAEIGGPKGASADAVREFLNSLGNCWAPLELNPWRVIERERQGELERAPISEHFVISYFQQRAYDKSPEGSTVLDLSADSFFQLGAVLDWAHEPGAEVTDEATAMDETLRGCLASVREDFDKDPASLDRRLPPLAFDPRRPATFVFVHLLRMLVTEWKAYHFKKNDALDFCHAVLAAASAGVATLDKQWKRRVENLPKPNQLARVFYRPEVDQLVELLETAVAELVSGNA